MQQDPYIESSKNTIERMMRETQENFKGVEVKFGFVAYLDHSDDKILEIKDLSDYKAVVEYMNGIEATGGGYIYHVADAPPHGTEYNKDKNGNYPNGCHCNVSLDQIAEKLNTLGIKYVLMKPNHECDKMKGVFKQKFKSVQETLMANRAKKKAEIEEKMVIADSSEVTRLASDNSLAKFYGEHESEDEESEDEESADMPRLKKKKKIHL